MKKRVGIYCFYDKDGIVDDFVPYLLTDIMENLDTLYIVCNGKLSKEGEQTFKRFTNHIVIRENKGFDAEAWKEVILSTPEIINNYDELLLFNNSFYGPLYPFKQVFDEMDEKHDDADFWGLTIHGKFNNAWGKKCSYGYIPEHIQSYFLVIRKKLLKDPAYYTYWKNLQPIESFDDAILLNEVVFTQYFKDKGFKFAVFCDTRDWEKDYDVKINNYLFNSTKLLTKFNMPVIKRKVFDKSKKWALEHDYGEDPRKTLEYVRRSSNYNLGLIIHHLLRIMSISDIKSILNLDYIIPSDVRTNIEVDMRSKVAIFVYLKYEDMLEDCCEYMGSIPSFVDIYIFSHKQIILDEAKALLGQKISSKVVSILVEPFNREIEILIKYGKEYFDHYELIGFIHDRKSTNKKEAMAEGRSFFELQWNNMLSSENYIRNTLALFETDNYLGLLVPPVPYHGKYAASKLDSWFHEMSDIKSLCKQLDLRVPLPTDHNFLCGGAVFWARTNVINKLFDSNWCEIKNIQSMTSQKEPLMGTIEKTLPLLAQSEGYYTGWVMTTRFAAAHIENLYIFSDSYWFGGIRRMIGIKLYTKWGKGILKHFPQIAIKILKPLEPSVMSRFKKWIKN